MSALRETYSRPASGRTLMKEDTIPTETATEQIEDLEIFPAKPNALISRSVTTSSIPITGPGRSSKKEAKGSSARRASTSRSRSFITT